MTQPRQQVRFEERLYDAPFLAVFRELLFYCTADRFNQSYSDPDYELVLTNDQTRDAEIYIGVSGRFRTAIPEQDLRPWESPRKDYILGITAVQIRTDRTAVRLSLYESKFDALLSDTLSRFDLVFLDRTTMPTTSSLQISDETPAQLDELTTPVSEEPVHSSDPTVDNRKPSEQIPDHRWDRYLIDLLHDPERAADDYERLARRIERQIKRKLSASRVASRVSELRKLYGEDIVPKRPKGRKESL